MRTLEEQHRLREEREMRPVPLPAEQFEYLKRLGEAAGATAEQVEQLAFALANFPEAVNDKPATYTNRAARRARARAERKRA